MLSEYRLILKHADQPGYTPDIECYLRHGGYGVLKQALALVDIRTLDHFVVAGNHVVSFAERGLI